MCEKITVLVLSQPFVVICVLLLCLSVSDPIKQQE